MISTNKMTSSIYALFAGFSDYLSDHVILTNPKTNQVHVTYVYLTYDLIDKDLDFDEEYHIKFMANFRKVLFEECKTVIACGTCTEIDITCAKLVMKEQAVVEHHILLDGTSSGITSYTSEPCF